MTRMDGGPFSVFDRSILVSNGLLHDKVPLFSYLSEPTCEAEWGGC